MSAISSDLEQFLEVVGKVSAVVAEDGRSVGDGWDSVEGAGLPTLARDSADETDSLQWLAHTVRVAAASSPSLAYVLAARYTADLAISDGVARRPTFALASPHSRPVAATSPEPDAVVALGVDDWQVRLARWDGVADSAEVEPRTGLTDARQASFTVPQDAELCESDGRALMTTWDLLIGAALVGIAERALDVTSTYVAERRQFGVPIGSFAGLRALVAGMHLRVEPLRAVLEHALDGSLSSDEVAATAGSAALGTCLDAIQAHGGYGYITEYPVADMLRDAVSLQARGGGRRLHVARVALRGLGVPEEPPS